MKLEGALQELRCSICGQISVEPRLSEGLLTPRQQHDSSTVCEHCSSRLSLEIAKGQTTIIRDSRKPASGDNSASVAAVDAKPKTGSVRAVENKPSSQIKPASQNRFAGEDQHPGSDQQRHTAEDLLASRLDSHKPDDGGAEFEFAKKRIFGSYELLGEISRGSFGVVYKARQAGLDRIVALKVLLDGAHASKESVERFHREAKSVARLKHPNVVPIYDIGTWDGHHYFAMEFIEGHPLSAHILARSLSIADSLAIAVCVADAIECAHRAGVIHRDIKPSNILLDHTGTPHITDFGLAKQVDLDNKYTLSGTTLGTPAYMPPEQARGQLEKIDARSDVYSLGTVLYEMLTGVTPFSGRSLLEVVVAVINEPVPPPRGLNPKIHRDIQTIVMKCLEKEPKNRYDSAASLRDDLRRFRSGEAILARPAGIFSRGGRYVARRAWYFATAAIVMAATAAYFYDAALGRQKDQVTSEVIAAKDRRVRDLEERQKPKWMEGWTFEGSKSLEVGTANSYAIGGVVPAAETRVTPNSKRFFGDVRARLEFTLTAEGASAGFSAGIQSITTIDGIPFSAQFEGTTVRLSGPVDAYSFSNNYVKDKNAPLKLEVKLEKEIPPLISANYVMNVERDGMRLRFQLSGEAPPETPTAKPLTWGPVSFEILDFNLSHWSMKHTQIVLIRPPLGLVMGKVVVEHKLGALNNFLTGEYGGAEIDYSVLIKDSHDGDTRAEAKYYLGLIKEICLSSGSTIEEVLALYQDAKQELYQLPLSDDPGLTRARRELMRRLHVRLIVSYAKKRDLPAAERWRWIRSEIDQGWTDNGHVGELLGWELQGVLDGLHKEPLMDKDAGDAIAAAVLDLYAHTGLSPASSRLASSAVTFGRILVARTKFADLRELYKSVPSPELYPLFADGAAKALQTAQLDEAYALLTFLPDESIAKTRALTDRAAECVAALAKTHRYANALALLLRYPANIKGFVALCNELGAASLEPSSDAFYANVVAKISLLIPVDPAAQQAFEAAAIRLGRTLIEHGRDAELIPLHNALRLGARQDARLAPLFVESIGRLAASTDPADEELALKLLHHAHEHVAKAGGGVRKAAVDMAEKKAASTDEDSYKKLLIRIKEACPTANLEHWIKQTLDGMNQSRRPDDVITYFILSRPIFTVEGPALLPEIIAALENTPAALRTKALESISTGVRDELRKRDDDYALHQWLLDDGDIHLALGSVEAADRNYRSLLAVLEDDPATASKAALRARALSPAHPEFPLEGVEAALAAPGSPDDIRLAGEFLDPLSQLKVEEIEKKRKQFHAPVLSDAEWKLVFALRLRQEQKDGPSQDLLRQCVDASAATRQWCGAVASELLHTHDSPRPELSVDAQK